MIKIFKKGQGVGTLRAIILILIIAVALFAFANKLIASMTGGIPREVCRASVLARYSEKLPVVEQEPTFDLQCFTQVLNIDKDGIEKIAYNGINRKKYKVVSFKKLDADKIDVAIKRNIANEMYDCWYQFHQGEFDFFGNWGTRFSTQRTRCVVCSQINFNENIKEKLNTGKLIGLQKFLLNKLVTSNDYTYMQYFLNMDNDPELTAEFQKADENFNDELNFNEQYSIVYYMTKGKDYVKAFEYTGAVAVAGTALGTKAGIFLAPFTEGISVPAGAAIGAIIGTVAGGGFAIFAGTTKVEEDGIPGMIIKQSSDISDICTTLY